MIVQSFNSKRAPKYTYIPATNTKPWYTAQEYAAARARNISPEEYVRRDKVVKELATACPFQTGDTAYPHDKKGYEEYGVCVVIGICRSYKDFNVDEEWPKNDNPYILSFAPMNDRKNIVMCTSNYLTKRNTHLEVC